MIVVTELNLNIFSVFLPNESNQDCKGGDWRDLDQNSFKAKFLLNRTMPVQWVTTVTTYVLHRATATARRGIDRSTNRVTGEWK